MVKQQFLAWKTCTPLSEFQVSVLKTVNICVDFKTINDKLTLQASQVVEMALFLQYDNPKDPHL